MTDNGWHETDIRVRYKDTDRMGVVYYGNYLTFFEIGRTEFMREMGFPYSRLENKGHYLVVTETAVKYHGNVGYDSVITIRARITNLKIVRLRFDYEVVDKEGSLIVNGHTVHACMDSNNKPSRIPSELREVINRMIIN